MFYSDRPKLKLEKTTLDYILDCITFCLIGLSLLYTIYWYSELPHQIPMKFSRTGEVNRYGTKFSILILQTIGIITTLAIFYLNKFPHIFNYPKRITKQNAKTMYSEATRMLRFLNVGIALIFATISYEIINIAIGNTNKIPMISSYILISVVVIIIVGPIIYLLKHLKTK